MNIDLKLDLSKLSPAPWQVEDFPSSWPSITSGPADDANERRSIDDPMELPDMVMCAMARNFLDIVSPSQQALARPVHGGAGSKKVVAGGEYGGESMTCPKCDHPCDRDEVAILTGMLNGPWVCRGCGWSDDSQRDWSKGVPSAAVTVDDYLMQKMR